MAVARSFLKSVSRGSFAFTACVFLLGVFLPSLSFLGYPIRAFDSDLVFWSKSINPRSLLNDSSSSPIAAPDSNGASDSVSKALSQTSSPGSEISDDHLNVNATSTATSSSKSAVQNDGLRMSHSQTPPVSNSSCNMLRPPAYHIQHPDDPKLPDVVLDYIEFHKTARACLLDPECKEKPQVLVATCPRKRSCLGLGDRMRGLQFSVTIAIVTRRVLFLHALGTGYPLEAGLSPFAIDWTLPPTIQYNHSWPHLEWYWCRQNKTCKNGSPGLDTLSSFDGHEPDINLYADDIVKVFSDKPVVSLACRLRQENLIFHERNLFLNGTYGELSRNITRNSVNLLRLLFQPSEGTRQILKEVEFSDEHLSVHIRTGIETKETKLERFQYAALHEEETVDRTLQCVSVLARERKIRNLFIASDSAETKRLFVRKGEEKGFEVHALMDTTLHIAKSWINGPLTLDSHCRGYLSVFVDIFMLARGKKMIRTSSHLSYFAGFLGGNPGIVIRNDNRTLEEWCRS